LGIIEDIEAAKQEGRYEEDKEWLEQDLKKSKHFCTIGIGGKTIIDHKHFQRQRQFYPIA